MQCLSWPVSLQPNELMLTSPFFSIFPVKSTKHRHILAQQRSRPADNQRFSSCLTLCGESSTIIQPGTKHQQCVFTHLCEIKQAQQKRYAFEPLGDFRWLALWNLYHFIPLNLNAPTAANIPQCPLVLLPVQIPSSCHWSRIKTTHSKPVVHLGAKDVKMW